MDVYRLLAEIPIAGVMALFAWSLLRIVGSTLDHYHQSFDGVLMEMLAELKALRDVTSKCVK